MPNIALSIWTLACFRLLYQSPLKNMAQHYEPSFLSHCLTNLSLSKNQLTDLMLEIGKPRPQMAQFFQRFVSGSEHIVFDTTHLISMSQTMQKNQIGYNSQGEFDPQVNLFYLFSTDKQLPVYYRLFPGNIHGMKAISLAIKESGLKNCTAVGDKGFCSEENIHLFQKENLDYVLPLKRNSSWIDYTRLSSRLYDQAYDGHFLYHKRPIFYYRYAHQDKNIIVFMDSRLRLEEEAAYLTRIGNNIEGYTMDGFRKKEVSFGTFAIVTNLKEASAETVYIRYKSRSEVETVFNAYKNTLQADRSYMHTDEAFEGWMFINHVATLLHYKIHNLLKEKDKLSSLPSGSSSAALPYTKNKDNRFLDNVGNQLESIEIISGYRHSCYL